MSTSASTSFKSSIGAKFLFSIMKIYRPITSAMAIDWKATTTPLVNPRLLGENHSQASKSDAKWNMLVPIAVKKHYITINVQTFEHTINEMDPVSMQTQLTQRTALIGVANSTLAATGEKRL